MRILRALRAWGLFKLRVPCGKGLGCSEFRLYGLKVLDFFFFLGGGGGGGGRGWQGGGLADTDVCGFGWGRLDALLCGVGWLFTASEKHDKPGTVSPPHTRTKTWAALHPVLVKRKSPKPEL